MWWEVRLLMWVFVNGVREEKRKGGLNGGGEDGVDGKGIRWWCERWWL